LSPFRSVYVLLLVLLFFSAASPPILASLFSLFWVGEQAVGYPADLIKTRIQASTNPNDTILSTARDIVKEGNNSYASLYRGFGLKLVRSVPASMIGFTVYEFVRKHIIGTLQFHQ
jgi:Mitochondrial carrier protein